MGIPVPVQTGEASCRERLVDRRVVRHPGIPTSDRSGVLGKQQGKGGLEQIGVAGPASVVDQTYDRSYSQRLQTAETLIGPGPVRAGYTLGGGPLPEDRVTESADTQRRKALQVIRTIGVTRTLYLVEVPLAYAIDRT